MQGPGLPESGRAWPFPVDQVPQAIQRRTERRSTALWPPLVWLCCEKSGSFQFLKIPKGFEAGLWHTLQSRSGESGVLSAFMHSPLAGGCHSWAVATVVCTCLLGHISEVPSLWTLSLFPPVLPFVLCSFCLSQLCLRSAALLPLLPSNPPGTLVPRTVFQKNCCNPPDSSSLWLKEVEIKRKKWWFKK